VDHFESDHFSWFVDPIECRTTPSRHKLIESEVTRPEFSKAWVLPLFFLAESKSVGLTSCVKLKWDYSKSCPYVAINCCLFEAVIYFHEGVHVHFLVPERQFMSWPPFGNSREDCIKNSRDPSCVLFEIDKTFCRLPDRVTVKKLIAGDWRISAKTIDSNCIGRMIMEGWGEEISAKRRNSWLVVSYLRGYREDSRLILSI
jgi:hypothetical protein